MEHGNELFEGLQSIAFVLKDKIYIDGAIYIDGEREKRLREFVKKYGKRWSNNYINTNSICFCRKVDFYAWREDLLLAIDKESEGV